MTVKMVVPVADSRLFWGCIPPLPFSMGQRNREATRRREVGRTRNGP